MANIREGIATLGDGADPEGMAVAKLLAQAGDVDREVASVVSMRVTPGASGEDVTRRDALLVAGQGVEELELDVGEIYGAAVDPGEEGAAIDGKVAER